MRKWRNVEIEDRHEGGSVLSQFGLIAMPVDPDPIPDPEKLVAHFYGARRAQHILGDIMDTHTSCVRVAPSTSLAQGEKNSTPGEGLGHKT